MTTKQKWIGGIIVIIMFMIVGAIEGKSIKDCVDLGHSLSKCKSVNGVR